MADHQGRVVELFRLPRSLTELSRDDRLKAITKLSKPVSKKTDCTALPELSYLDECLVVLEFVFFMLCLFLPAVGAMALAIGLYRLSWIPVLVGSLLLYLCVENLSTDRYPNEPPTANTRRFLEYFALRVIYEDPAYYSESASIFPMVPHGVHPATVIGAAMIAPRTPMVRMVMAQASSTMAAPYWRTFARQMGSVPASRHEIQRVLDRGDSVTTFMDGIHGMFAGGRGGDVEKLYIENKKGLIRLAMTNGTPLVPCYCFGQTELVRVAADPLGIMESFSRRLRVSLVVPLGRWFLPVPYRVPLTLAMGRPILVDKIPEGTKPDPVAVDALHALYLKETEALFERYKGRCGYGHKRIEVL
jgi:2-acylglycerol O-acyltransferase 2